MRVRRILGMDRVGLQTDVASELLCRAAGEDESRPGPETSQGRFGRPGERSDIDGEARELVGGGSDALLRFISPMRVGDAAIKILVVTDRRSVRAVGRRRLGRTHARPPVMNQWMRSTAVPTSLAGKLSSASTPSSGLHWRSRIEWGDSNSSSKDLRPACHSRWSPPLGVGTTRGRGGRIPGSLPTNASAEAITAGSIAGAP
jgi:hypothetical protein